MRSKRSLISGLIHVKAILDVFEIRHKLSAKQKVNLPLTFSVRRLLKAMVEL